MGRQVYNESMCQCPQASATRPPEEDYVKQHIRNADETQPLKYLTVRQFAESRGFCTGSVYRMIAGGYLHAERVGRRSIRIPVDS